MSDRRSPRSGGPARLGLVSSLPPPATTEPVQTVSSGPVIPADVQQVLIVKEEVPPDWSSSLDQENPEPLHIKNEQEELWISQQGEQLNGLEEADINRFPFSAASVKSEDDEEKPQLSPLHQSQTEDNRDREPRASSSAMEVKTESDAEDCGGSEPARNPDPDSHSQPNPDETDSDSSETDVSDDGWQEPLADSGPETGDAGKNQLRVVMDFITSSLLRHT
ncbi:hypothetical protein D5F01_LYC17167 [Larimichthys crocea]|uniref:Uncharacterized protein n=1 Tax=Larimichthys crocea TaxID=215358 RepID=A0A6G0HXV0_LARCR|nr:hypothetical protein D5F01_LYC17167 [Larimichthys crocea]